MNIIIKCTRCLKEQPAMESHERGVFWVEPHECKVKFNANFYAPSACDLDKTYRIVNSMPKLKHPSMNEIYKHCIRCENMDAYYTIFGNPPPGAIGAREFHDMCWKFIKE